MNQRVKKQLQQIKSTSVEFDDNTTKIFIPKTVEIRNESLEVGKVYLIELSDDMLSPTSNSTLASNWNGGKVPKYKDYYAELIKVINNMYQFNCVSVKDQTSNFLGYIPRTSFKVKEVL